METWKATECDGYEVSNLGRVRSYRGSHGSRRDIPRVLRPQACTNGYLSVGLPREDGTGRFRHALIHRLVAMAFIGEPPNRDDTVNHKDLDKKNNEAANLEWMSHADNNRHAAPLIPHERGERRRDSVLTEECVRRIREAHLFGANFSPLGRAYGVSLQTISSVCKRQKWRHV